MYVILRLVFISVFVLLCAFDSVSRHTSRSKSGSKSSDSHAFKAIELASKASSNGGTIIAAHNRDTCIMLTWKQRGNVNISPPYSKLQQVADNMVIGVSGIVSDGNHLSNKLFEMIQHNHLTYNSNSNVCRSATAIGEYMHGMTLSTQLRPFGVSLCIMGFDDVHDAMIVELDPLGNCRRCKVTCLGPYSNQLMSLWDRNRYDPIHMDSTDLLDHSISILNKCLSNRDITLHPDDVTVCFTRKNTENSFNFVSRDEIVHLLQRNNINCH